MSDEKKEASKEAEVITSTAVDELKEMGKLESVWKAHGFDMSFTEFTKLSAEDVFALVADDCESKRQESTDRDLLTQEPYKGAIGDSSVKVRPLSWSKSEEWKENNTKIRKAHEKTVRDYVNLRQDVWKQNDTFQSNLTACEKAGETYVADPEVEKSDQVLLKKFNDLSEKLKASQASLPGILMPSVTEHFKLHGAGADIMKNLKENATAHQIVQLELGMRKLENPTVEAIQLEQ